MFEQDLDFLRQHQEVLVLKSNDDQRQVVIVPEFQGRIMTSTSKGLQGSSYGWINYDLIASGEIMKHMNAYGGEDRFWLGPESGQFGLFFKPGSDFVLEQWQTPPAIDTEAFNLKEQGDASAVLEKNIQLQNYQGFQFDVHVRRVISLLKKKDIEQTLSMPIHDSIDLIGFESENRITNTSDSAWEIDQGLLSIWILGMYRPSDQTSVIIPYKNELELNTSYFGEIAANRLQVLNEAVLFKGDANFRSKIGLPHKNVLPFIGSYDALNSVLTIVHYSLNDETMYVNSMWEHQAQPYEGDVLNAYNDGPDTTGKAKGLFYELETSSPTRPLKQHESIDHVHKTFHFEGPFDELNNIARAILHVDLNDVVWG